MKIHISIIDFHKSDRVQILLDSLAKQSLYSSTSICVLDNSNCSENFKTLYNSASNKSNISLIRSKENLGYTKATNLSVDSSADYIFLINPDIILPNNKTLEQCIEKIQSTPKTGVLGLRQVTDSGEFELIARRFPSLLVQIARRIPALRVLPAFKRKVEEYEDSSTNQQTEGTYVVDWVQSSFWLVPGEVWRAIGGLPEENFLFMSEPHFSQSAKNLGYNTVIYSDIAVISDGIRASGGGLSGILKSKVLRMHILDAFKYYLIKGFRKIK